MRCIEIMSPPGPHASRGPRGPSERPRVSAPESRRRFAIRVSRAARSRLGLRWCWSSSSPGKRASDPHVERGGSGGAVVIELGTSRLRGGDRRARAHAPATSRRRPPRPRPPSPAATASAPRRRRESGIAQRGLSGRRGVHWPVESFEAGDDARPRGRSSRLRRDRGLWGPREQRAPGASEQRGDGRDSVRSSRRAVRRRRRCSP